MIMNNHVLSLKQGQRLIFHDSLLVFLGMGFIESEFFISIKTKTGPFLIYLDDGIIPMNECMLEQLFAQLFEKGANRLAARPCSLARYPSLGTISPKVNFDHLPRFIDTHVAFIHKGQCHSLYTRTILVFFF